ncbi:PTS sugar transporter subunit IIA [Methylophilaceae bacterium]|jgi:PTS system mannose-specific IIA component|nr:PTS sugar transporter subunit IIA [Methylophilaceae bacterium]MDC1173686.1 PTS sugar transporter subunit IIA [Methylophilaceae bacterium]|tara:strand:- start:205 stop:594 length:390 start_codon:yes stop_codon:yes gene_type:complete
MIGILLVTHGEIGKSFIDCASHILGKSINLLECIPVDPKSNLEECQEFINIEIKNLDTGTGVLILTDIYGATPSNILKKFTTQDNVEVITGINLPMLIQAITNRDGKLSQVTSKCMQSAEDSIIRMDSK